MSATKLELLPPPDAYHRSRGWAQTPARLWEQGSAATDGESQGMGVGKLGRNRARARHRTGDKIQHHPVYVSMSARAQPTSVPGPRPIHGARIESSKSCTPMCRRAEGPGWAHVGLLGSG